VAPPGLGTLTVRPLNPELDGDRLLALCPRLSLHTRHQRFFVGLRTLSPPLLEQLLDVDHDRREALLALDEHDELVAVARYTSPATRPREAELGLLVADGWQHRGVGTHLLTLLRDLATTRGINTFTATTQLENQQAR
jgi:acetyltransferase